MGKLTSYPPDTAPTVDDLVPTIDTTTGGNRKVALSDLITLFFNNQPANAATSTTLAQDTMTDFIKSGGVITADSVGVSRNASMTALTCYQNGQKLTVAAVTARSYTASKDTYVDVLNTAGVATLVYTEVTNNAASPALAANSIRLGIVVTGATTIAAATSISQHLFTNILPVISSQTLRGFDTLGNIIYPTGAPTAAKFTNPYKFRVYGLAAQNTINGSTKVLYDTKTYDTHNDFDVATNHRFVAPVAGYYSVTAAIQIVSSANCRLDLYKNGSAISQGVNNGGSGVNQGSIVSDTVQLAAGDYLEIFVSAASAVAIFVGQPGNYFSGFLVSTS